MTRAYQMCATLALAASLAAAPTASYADVFVGAGVGLQFGIGVSVNTAPPPIPVYVQPPCLVADTIWVPGYWAYGAYGYYWVPGTWVAAPQIGYLWTPGYWGFGSGAYGWHPGYWGRHVGFYGGVNYGFGYAGAGYAGGGWAGNHFRYNTAVTNVSRTTITNVYVNNTAVNNNYGSTIQHVSYNGGPGGISRQPSSQELAYRDEPHVPTTVAQNEHNAVAAENRNFLASVNHGSPANAAFARPLNAENRPANFAPVTSTHRRAPQASTAATSVDPSSRFNHQTPNVNGERTLNSNRGLPSYAARNPQDASGEHDRASESNADRAPAAQHPVTIYVGTSRYNANTYGEPNTYHAPSAYRAPSTYHAPSAYRAPSTYHAPTTYRPTSMYHAPANHPRTASHPSGASHPSASHQHESEPRKH